LLLTFRLRISVEPSPDRVDFEESVLQKFPFTGLKWWRLCRGFSR
jgi:hypothetical protein